MKFLDLTGHRFGKLVVTELKSRSHSKAKAGTYKDTIWYCLCDCGNKTSAGRGNLKGGSVSSCGCVRNTQDGLSRAHPLWKRWAGMLSRCEKQNDKDFANYGKRGISVCKRWHHFPSFIKDMEKTFFKGATLERKNNNGNYEPHNCRWATRREQLWNQRHTILIDTPWGRISRGEAAMYAGIPTGRFISRLKSGWSIERLLDPANKGKMHRWTRQLRE